MEKRKRRSFTKEYKAEVVDLVRKSSKSVGAIAKELDLAETAVRAWVRQAEVDAGRGPAGALTTAERDELGKLRKQVKIPEMEREIPRKAALPGFGWVAEEREMAAKPAIEKGAGPFVPGSAL
jgi:transposase